MKFFRSLTLLLASAITLLLLILYHVQAQSVQSTVNAKDGAEMILIPAGDFLMGDDDENDNPRHKVKLSSYYIYKNLVTVGQYKQFCKETGRRMPKALDFNPKWSKENHPIINVRWEDASAYAKWAGGDLPTEAQWEKAARGTDGLKYPWGNDWDEGKLWWFKDSSEGTGAIGSFPSGKSPYGVNDMAGNVWQWCRDEYDPEFWKKDQGTDPLALQGVLPIHVMRGGSWVKGDPDDFRAANRHLYSIRDDDVGFRCVVSAEPHSNPQEGAQKPKAFAPEDALAFQGKTGVLSFTIADGWVKVDLHSLVALGAAFFGLTPDQESALQNELNDPSFDLVLAGPQSKPAGRATLTVSHIELPRGVTLDRYRSDSIDVEKEGVWTAIRPEPARHIKIDGDDAIEWLTTKSLNGITVKSYDLAILVDTRFMYSFSLQASPSSFPAAMEEVQRMVRSLNVPAAPKPASGDIYVGTALSPGYNLGVDTSAAQRDWVKDEQSDMKCEYPSGQSWGAVFITYGNPVPAIKERKARDFSAFQYLTLEVRGVQGGEHVSVGVKTADDPDDGNEPKYQIKNLTTQWRLVKIPLKKLSDGDSYPACRFHNLYVVCEFVFEPDTPAETICFRNVRYTK